MIMAITSFSNIHARIFGSCEEGQKENYYKIDFSNSETRNVIAALELKWCTSPKLDQDYYYSLWVGCSYNAGYQPLPSLKHFVIHRCMEAL